MAYNKKRIVSSFFYFYPIWHTSNSLLGIWNAPCLIEWRLNNINRRGVTLSPRQGQTKRLSVYNPHVLEFSNQPCTCGFIIRSQLGVMRILQIMILDLGSPTWLLIWTSCSVFRLVRICQLNVIKSIIVTVICISKFN